MLITIGLHAITINQNNSMAMLELVLEAYGKPPACNTFCQATLQFYYFQGWGGCRGGGILGVFIFSTSRTCEHIV